METKWETSINSNFRSDNKAVRDAALISAAPELLTTLKELIKKKNSNYGHFIPNNHKWWDKAIKVIKKAEGKDV